MIRVVAGLIVLVLLALPLRDILAHPARLSVLPSLQVDAAAYDAIAADIARTKSLDPIPPLQPPGFVLTMAAVYAIAGHTWVAGKVFLWLVLVACVALAAGLAWRLHRDEWHAWTAAILTAAAPALHAYAGTIQYELVAAAWLLVLILYADWARTRSIGAYAILGLLAGAAALTREVFIAVVPVLGLYLAHQQCQSRGAKQAMLGALVVVTCAIAPAGAWALLQTAQAGRVVPISDKGSLVLAFGNNPHANGTFNAPLAGVGRPAGLNYIRAEPARTLRLAGRKFLYFWGVLRDGWNVPRLSAVWLARTAGGTIPLQWILPAARGGWLLTALVVALVLWPLTTWRRWWVVPGSIAAILTVHLITVSSHRFAVPVLPLMFAIVAAPLTQVARWCIASLAGRAAVVALLITVAAMQQPQWPIRYALQAADMDGLDASNVVAPGLGLVRAADAARGRRAVLLLSDEALPRGTFSLMLRLRAAASAGDQPIAHVWLQTTDGERVCDQTIPSSDALAGQWVDVTMPCSLRDDTVATLAVETTGVVDIAFQSLQLQW